MPIWRSCAGSTNCAWTTRSWALVCYAINWRATASHVGRRHIRTLMLRMGIEALAPRNPEPARPRLATRSIPTCCPSCQSPTPIRSGRFDTTYIPMAKGFVYLTAVVDVSSRRVLAHKVAITLEACHAREIIDEAFARHGMPQIVNVDQGSQFTANDFTLTRCIGAWVQTEHGWARMRGGTTSLSSACGAA